MTHQSSASDNILISDSESESVASKESAENSLMNELMFLRHQNKRLRDDLAIYKNKVDNLNEENRELRLSKCQMQAKVEVEEEFITNSLLRQIATLRKKIDSVITNFNHEEQLIVGDLSKKMGRLQNEKVKLEQSNSVDHEERCQKLQARIKKLEEDTNRKQHALEQIRREKGDIQNTLEQEQEALLNRLWRNISQVEQDRKVLSEKMEVVLAGGNSASPRSYTSSKRLSTPSKNFSLTYEELSKMPFEEMTNYVLNLQKELTKLQNESSHLDSDKYQKLLLDCNFREEDHWLKKKFSHDIHHDSIKPYGRISRVSRSGDSSSSDSFKPPGSLSKSPNIN